MQSLRRLTRALGRAGMAVVILVPVVTTLIAALLAPRLVQADQRATGQVSVYEVTGTHAAFEVASHVADFQEALKSPDTVRAANRAAAAAGGAAGAAVGSMRLGDSTNVLVTFDAVTARGAAAGLQEAVRTALGTLAAAEQERAAIELRAAVRQLEAPVPGLAGAGVAPSVVERTRDRLRTQAEEDVFRAQSRVVLADTIAESVDGLADAQETTVEALSTLQDRIRIVVTAAVSSLVLSLLGVLGLRALTGRPGSSPVVEPAHLVSKRPEAARVS